MSWRPSKTLATTTAPEAAELTSQDADDTAPMAGPVVAPTQAPPPANSALPPQTGGSATAGMTPEEEGARHSQCIPCIAREVRLAESGPVAARLHLEPACSLWIRQSYPAPRHMCVSAHICAVPLFVCGVGSGLRRPAKV